MRRILLVLAVVAAVPLAGCVSARNEDGTVSFRVSRLADEAEVAAVGKRVDGIETALTTERTERVEADQAIRADVKAADDAAGAAFQSALAQGKSATEAMGAATAAAAAEAQRRADEATAKALKASADAEAAKKGRDEIDSGIIGKLGIEEILAMLGITAGGVGYTNIRRNKTRAKALAKVAEPKAGLAQGGAPAS